MYLIDTNILSALRRRNRNPDVVRWIESQRMADLYISVVTVGEIERGIVQQQRHNPDFARDLSGWLDRVLDWYGDRIIPVDVATARRSAVYGGVNGGTLERSEIAIYKKQSNSYIASASSLNV